MDHHGNPKQMPSDLTGGESRRKWLHRFLAIGAVGSIAGTLPGCGPLLGLGGGVRKEPIAVWGVRGSMPGRLQKPRAIAIDKNDHLYIVDITPRIQVFDTSGNFLRGWQTPEFANGKPSGLAFDHAGNLLVADTHYFRILTYTPDGKLLDAETIGGVCGGGPGEFSFVTDCVQDSQGNFYVSAYGEFDKIQKFSPERKYLLEWGGHGTEPGSFMRPQKMAIDSHDHLWVADACNHRVQIFDATGTQAKLVKTWGSEGTEPGKLRYPYDIWLDGKGHVYLCEFGNHRVSKFSEEGEFIGSWGQNGRKPGELDQPWGMVQDSQGNCYVLDTYNHRVQQFLL